MACLRVEDIFIRWIAQAAELTGQGFVCFLCFRCFIWISVDVCAELLLTIMFFFFVF